MKQLLCLAALLALAIARPELYKETEEFQYSRHSSDEGSKAGYYGARRGNMGGNYEKAHNMDHLAQNQMSGLVRQVDGEVGEASKLRTGNVFADASSAGIYGSGHYDTSNLRGRNFQEGVREGSFADTHSELASHSNSHLAGQAYHSSGYNSHAANSMYSGYQGTKSAQALQSANLQSSADAASGYERETGYNAGHHSQYEYQGAHNGYGVHPSNRLIVTTPVRVVVRPGGRVAVPVGVQNYDASHSASTMEHNAINTDAEVLNIPDHVIYKPSSSAKGYETSSSYQKHWEKHDVKPEVIPLAIPTENPFPINSELYDEHNAQHSSAQASHGAIKSNVYNGYNANVKSSSSQSRYQSAHDSQYASGLNAQGYNAQGYNAQGYNAQGFNAQGFNAQGYNTHGAYVGGIADASNVLDESRPKSHQSSYSYHKSWERQGDPYVIKPVGGVDSESQRLIAASANQGHMASHEYGAHTKSSQQRYYQANGIDCDCDENGQIRVARSVDTQQQQQNKWEDLSDLTQQAQTSWGHERQHASDNLKEFGRQSQNHWDDTTQQAQSRWDRHRESASEKLEDLGQQTQKQWGDLTQQSQTGWNTHYGRQQNLEKFDELGHQTRAEWDRQHARASEKFEDLGQQTQKQWGDLTQQTQTGWNTHHGREHNLEKIDELGHHSQAAWDGHRARASEKLEDLGQRTENKWDDLTQQTQTSWDGHSHNGHHRRADQKLEEFGQHTQIDLVRQPQVTWDREDIASIGKPDNLKHMMEKPQKPWDLEDLGQKPQNPWHLDIGQKQNSDNFEQQTQAHSGFEILRSFNQKKNNTQDKVFSSETHYINTHNKTDEGNALDQQNDNWKLYHAHHNDDDLGQETQQQSLDEFFHYSNINKDVRTDSQVKPVTPLSKWDQTEDEDNTQQIVQKPFAGFLTRPSNPWKPMYETQQSTDVDQQNEMQQSQHGWGTNGYSGNWQGHDYDKNNNSNKQTQDKSLQSLWDKINEFDKVSTNSSKHQKNHSTSWQEQSTSQSSYHSSWQQGREAEHNSNFRRNFDYNKQHGSTGYGYDSWIPMIGDPGMISSVSTSTVKPISINQNKNIRPVDVGRGDIGSEDASKITTTEKSFVSGYNQGFPIFTEDKRLKTPEEIEALSLTIHNENTNKSTPFNTSTLQDQYMDERLKVLSLEQQNWLQGQNLHGSNFSSSRDGLVNSVTDERRVGIFDTSYHSTNGQNLGETQETQTGRHFFYNKPVHQNNQGAVIGNEQTEPGFYTNKPVYHDSTKPTSDSQTSNTSQISQNTDNNYEGHHFDRSFDQQSQTAWGDSGHLGQERLNFDKREDNLEQQSEIAWGHNLANFGQQEKSASMSDNVHQQDTQQFEKPGRSGTDKYETEDFYNQRYYLASANDKNKKTEDHKVAPETESSKKVIDTQSAVQNKDQVPLAPMEPTEKPGFGKSVGKKVTSWFKST